MLKSKLLSAAATLALMFMLTAPIPVHAADPAPTVDARTDKMVKECMEMVMQGCDLVIQGSEMVSRGDRESVAKGNALIREGRAKINAGKNMYNSWTDEPTVRTGGGN